jgi:hypothetical protein
MLPFRPRIEGAIFGVLMVALPLYCLLAAVECGHRAVDERVTRGAEGDGRIDAQRRAEIDDIIKSLRRHAQPLWLTRREN